MAKNYSVLVGVELDTKNVQQQLNNNLKNLKVDLDADKAVKGLNDLSNSIEDVSLGFNSANEIFTKSIEVIGSLVEQVFELDKSLVEFQKVSNLSGDSLDDYVEKLQKMGTAVGRTGKPKCQAPDDGIVNQHQEPLEIQYNLRAYSTTMVA